MTGKSKIFAMRGALACVGAGLGALCLTGSGAIGQEAAPQSRAAELEAFSGIWEVSRRQMRRNGGQDMRGEGRQARPSGQRARPRAGEGEERGSPPDRGPSAEDIASSPLQIEGLDSGDYRTYEQMTPAGKAAFEAMDPRDLPANNCLSNGLPSLVGIPDLQEWSFEGDVLTIHYANFNTIRTIYLDGRAPIGEATLRGHSSAQIDGAELVVTTSNLIATAGGLGRNAPGSGSRNYVERYAISADGTQVSGSLTIHDPEYLPRDRQVPISFSRAPEGSEIPIVGCSVEASQRYLD